MVWRGVVWWRVVVGGGGGVCGVQGGGIYIRLQASKLLAPCGTLAQPNLGRLPLIWKWDHFGPTSGGIESLGAAPGAHSPGAGPMGSIWGSPRMLSR